MEGDVEGVMRRPPDDERPDTEQTRAEKEKWDAWHSNASLSRTAAKRAYISTLITSMHEYASSTPEARELVAELEFVWDQIKNNSNATSSESSPRGAAQDDQLGMSYASLSGSRRRAVEDEGGGGAGLRVLRPVSEGDDEMYDDEEDDEVEDGARLAGGRYRDLMDPASSTVGGSTRRDLDVRNRKWRKRIETALFKMTTEVAALREQIESKRIGTTSGKGSGAWAWLRWLVWAATRQLLIDAMMLGLVFLWARRKDDQRIERGLWLVMQGVKEQLRQVKELRVWRLRGSI
ncbi:MAG: hypothetical protein L6R40_003927 [Gallowayella cf. fulva]|nr:MAG: hypothetical protein L6R40_003927 [Xanthomendoza cf. fulva]